MARVTTAIAVGANLGDRESHLAFARDGLARLLDGCRMSAVIETEPVDVPGDPTPFLNAAVVGTTELPAVALLDCLHALERARGRQHPFRNAPRTLDLDLILYGDAIIEQPGLIVPHPRFRDRRFVLEPLADVAPQLVDPITGLTVAALLARL